MRHILHPLVVIVLFSLPWTPNGHLTPGVKIRWNHEVPPGLRNCSTDAGKENVVSLSRSIQVQHLARKRDSETRDAHVRISSGDVLNQRRKRNIANNVHNLTTALAESRMQIKQEETTPEKELLNLSSLKPQAFLDTTESSKTLQTEPLQEKTTRGLLDMKDKTQEILPTSDFNGFYDRQANRTDTDSNQTNTSVLQSTLPTLDNEVPSDPMTHTLTSTETLVTGFNETEGMKTTQRKEITDEQTTDSELKTSTMIKPVKTTTLKTTTNPVAPLPKNNQKNNPGPAVAAVIGTTFVLMFIAIIAILVRKRNIQKKQVENPDWAGPSPFLDGDVQPNLLSMESESFHRRGFNQISISRYLSQRLSKHLTLRRETNEEVFMGDILQGSTFGRKNLEEVQAPNGIPTPGHDSSKTEEHQNHQDLESAVSGDTETPTVRVDIHDSSTQNEDLTPALSQEPVIKPLTPLVSIDLDSLSEETSPFQTPDVGNIPPAPPLP